MRRTPSIRVASLTACAVVILALPACVNPYRLESPEENQLRSLNSRFIEIDALEAQGHLGKAIEVAELALVDHYDSQELRNRLAALRAHRHLRFKNDMRKADAAIDLHDQRTARAIYLEVESYGDEEMIRQVRAKRDLAGEPSPAIFKEN